MILSSHQPNFLPYMGFFYKAAKSDAMVISEDVSFSKKGMHNWNRIYTSSGVKKLTLPVKAHHDSRLADVVVADPAYNIPKIAKTLEQEYRKAPYFGDGMEVVDLMLGMASERPLFMSDFNVPLTSYILGRFGICIPLILSTEDLEICGHKDERIFQMCEQTGATAYLSGTGAKVYHVDEDYAKRGIDLIYSDYRAVRYPQVHGDFVENLSVIDYIFNMGFRLPEGWEKHGR